MSTITPCTIPENALLQRYRTEGAFVDCYTTTIPQLVDQVEYIAAFYTTPLFKLERLVLKWLVARPSTDLQARQLACGEVNRFAAWQVEDRTEDQLLLCDFQGRTRSWLMSRPATEGANSSTQLFFGSAVVHKIDPESGEKRKSIGFRLLLGFHKLYSRALLHSARAELKYH